MSNARSANGRTTGWRRIPYSVFRIPSLALITPLFLVSCLSSQEEPGSLGDRLAACTGKNSVFQDLPFKDWAAYYHDTVDDVIETHLRTLERVGTQRLRCDAPALAGVLPPSQPLLALAALLPPWQSSDRLSMLSELHAGSVLLEFLRVYECANLERNRDLNELINERAGGTINPSAGDGAWERGPFVDEMLKQRERITGELDTARTAFERTMDIVGSLDQFRAVAIELECLKRSSLDLRNALSLIADASACMTKAPGKSSLRDPPELPFAP